MKAHQTEAEAVVDEVIRLTTWQSIKRYVVLGGIGFLILDLVITLTVVVLLANATREADKNRATEIRAAEVLSCESLNSTHRQINEQNTAFLLHNEVTRDTFAANPNDPALRKAAHLYSEIGTAYRVLPLLDCRQAVNDPRGYTLPRSRRPTRSELRSAYRRYLSIHRKHVR